MSQLLSLASYLMLTQCQMFSECQQLSEQEAGLPFPYPREVITVSLKSSS